jgi:ribosomal protein S18 acetylase RimI-like enzyme
MTEPATTIRQATLEDYPRLHDVLASTLRFHAQAQPDVFRPDGTPPPSREFVAALLEEGRGAVFIAEHGGAVVGFLTIRRVQADQPFQVPRRHGAIDNVGVAPAWRRQGIGRALMAAAHDWARTQGLSRVQLNVWEFNTGAIALYESLGYTTFSRNMWVDL